MKTKENLFLDRVGKELVINKNGREKLAEFVTDPFGPVYAFNSNLSPVIVAAAMARLSRRMGDMRVTILDEFMLDEGEDANRLIERVVSNFGDDSVQQLAGIHIVVEGASNLLTKLLEWGRLASYLEQSTRYIYFDEVDADGKFRYYTPELEESLKQFFVQTMDEIFSIYSIMVRGITDYLRKEFPEPTDKQERAAWISSTRAAACDVVRPVLPAATKSTVGIFASTQAVERMIWNLMANPLQESRITGERILREARKIAAPFLTRTDQPERGNMVVAHLSETKANMKQLVKELIHIDSSNRCSWGDQVRIVSHWPPKELDLVPEMLFEYTGPLSLEEIREQVKHLSHKQKVRIFKAYMGRRTNRRHKPGRALENAHFEIEIVGDYGTFRDLQRHRIVDSWQWQQLSTVFGYEIPTLVCKAGFEDKFRKCFELSDVLFRRICGEVDDDGMTAQYAVLLGHYMRYRFTMNLRELFHFIELRTGPNGHPGYRRICNRIHDLLGRMYPLSAEAMIFVDKSESRPLGRLEAEHRTQKKLADLEQ